MGRDPRDLIYQIFAISLRKFWSVSLVYIRCFIYRARLMSTFVFILKPRKHEKWSEIRVKIIPAVLSLYDDDSFIKCYQLMYIYYDPALWVTLLEDKSYLIAWSQETLQAITYVHSEFSRLML